MKRNHRQLLLAQTKLLLLVLCFITYSNSFAQPTISAFTPATGPIGTTITITGTNFSPLSINNTVFFGSVKANVISSSSIGLSVTVPPGASFQPIAVTVNGLTAYSAKPFIVTFLGGVLTNNSFGYVDTLDDGINKETNDLAAADFDGDGKVDIAVVDRINNTLSVYKNTSTANNVSFGQAINYATGTQPVSIASGDIDGDGRLDVALTNRNDNTISVYRNTSAAGSISFATKVDFASAALPVDVAISDFDGDGKSDLAIANTTSSPSSFSVLPNTSSLGSISFGIRKDFPMFYSSTSMAIGDLNGDGKADIVTALGAANSMTVVTNTSSPGIFSFLTTGNFSTGSSPGGIAIGDLDGDNKPEITLANFFSNTISIFRNTTTSTTTSFAAASNRIVPGADNVSLFDADGDGKIDVSVQTFSPSGFSILKNSSTTGNISLGSPIAFPAICGDGIVSADWDGDGKADVGVGCGIYRVGFWKNKTTEPQILSFSPTSAPTGGTVTISGLNFSGVTAVSFGGVPASSFIVVNSTTITAVVSSGATGQVEITSPQGTSMKDGFVIANPPTIASFSPASATAGTAITITGTNLTGATSVSFGGVAANALTVVNSTTVIAYVGTGSSGNVVVTTPFGSANVAGFVFIAPPSITSFSPSFSGTGNTVSISGVNFTNASAVSFGGVPASSFTVISANLITAVVGAGASGDVSVTTPFGSASRAGFTYVPPPTITSFAPAAAKFGDAVLITGTNLNTVNEVRFGGVKAQSFSINSATSVSAIVGNGASGNVTVISTYGTGSLPGFVFLPPPTVTSFTPQSGPIGTTVIITGTDFTGATNVYFNGQPASAFSVLSPTMISAVTGTGNTGSIQVTTSNGFGVSSNSYTFIYPQPNITSFTPASATTGATVTITGTNFINVLGVSFGGVAASSFVVNLPTSISATVGTGASGSVIVSTTGGQATASGFTYLLPPPTITSSYPAYAGLGSSVSIAGTNFTNVTAVAFGGQSAASFIVNSSTSITAIVATGATGPVSVTTPRGTGTGSQFYYDSPQITSFAPTAGGGGTVVTITGSGFTNVSAVRFGGVPATSLSVQSPTSMTAVVGAGGGTGDVGVTTQASTGRRGGFTFITANTFIRSVSPAIASAGTTVTITGNNFTNASAVIFGGVAAASFIVVDPSTITAVIGAGASGHVSVTSPSGTATHAGFIYTTAPIITSLSPEAGPVGTTVVIAGTNFSPVASSNIVYFGAVKATVLSASSTRLEVMVPVGATFHPVLVTTNGLSTCSRKAFSVTFNALGSLNAAAFADRLDSATGNSPSHVNAADIDVDGKLDLAVAVGAPDRQITLFKNISSPGIISLVAKAVIPHNKNPTQTIFPDLDGDGKLDMVVANQNDLNGVSVFRNTSTPSALSFGSEQLLVGIVLAPFSVAAGDLDGDGKIDLAVASVYRQEVVLLKNTSQGGLISFGTPVRISLNGNYLQSIVLADMDQDAKPDIVISSVDGNTSPAGKLILLRNSSSATTFSFDPLVSYQTSGSSAEVTVADLDSDGRNDVAVVNTYLNTFSVFRNISMAGTIALDNKMEFITGINPLSVCVANLDGNSRPDLVIANSGSNNVSVFSNSSAGNSILFSSRFELPTGNNPYSIEVADIDSDQRPDIISANHGSGTISILRNLIDGRFISSFSPTSGSTGTVITITGENFTGATAVSFGNVPAQSFAVLSPTTISAVVGGGASGSVSVITPGGIATSNGFTYNVVTGIGSPVTNNVNDLTVSPNPASGNVIVEHPASIKNAQLYFVDVLGRALKQVLVVKNTKQTKVNLAGLAPGVYQIIWINGARSFSRSLLLNGK